jgi:hypothetical protein
MGCANNYLTFAELLPMFVVAIRMPPARSQTTLRSRRFKDRRRIRGYAG